jgi:hypothetical protein
VVETDDITGTVEAVNFDANAAHLVVDGEVVDPADVKAVYDVAPETESTESESTESA